MLVTRPQASAGELVAALEAAGAVAVPYPTIETTLVDGGAALDLALARTRAAATAYDWIVLTSATAVEVLASRADGPGALRSAPVAVVGQATARALRAVGVEPARVAADERQEGLVTTLADVAAGARVLFPRAETGLDLLPEALRARGVTVDVVAAYRTRARSAMGPLPDCDVVTFASPSAVEAFVGAHGRDVLSDARRKVVVIGPTTAAAATRAGIVVAATADEASAAGLVRAVLAAWRGGATSG